MPRSKNGTLSPVNRKWLGIVRACEQSGESLTRYAKRKGVSIHALYQAKKRARELGLLPPHRKTSAQPASRGRDRPPRFVEAVQRAQPLEASAAWRVRLPGGGVIESMTPLTIDDAMRLVESLRQPS